jgi:hypothetical protein
MTTHKAHVNLLHNQCLAIQAIVIFMDLNARRERSRANEVAQWIYEHAARRVLPALYEGTEEQSMPARLFTPRAFASAYLPKVMIADCDIDDEATLVDTRRVNKLAFRTSDTLKGIGT